MISIYFKIFFNSFNNNNKKILILTCHNTIKYKKTKPIVYNSSNRKQKYKNNIHNIYNMYMYYMSIFL